MKKIILTVLCIFTFNLFGEDLHNEAGKAKALYLKSNYQDAVNIYQVILKDKEIDQEDLLEGYDLYMQALQSLDRANKIDFVREELLAVHTSNWRLAQKIANSYLNSAHWGTLISNKFERNTSDQTGEYVSAERRDVVRAMQIYLESLPKVEKTSPYASDYFMGFADIFQNRVTWNLYGLTDITKLPEYNEKIDYKLKTLAVDTAGNPIYFGIPKTFNEAKSDWERWRFLLQESASINPIYRNAATYRFAVQLHELTGVQTVNNNAFWRKNSKDDKENNKYIVNTLTDDETIAKLASGVKRFNLPDEFNYIKISKSLAENSEGTYRNEALNLLARSYEDRRQYDQALIYLEKLNGAYSSSDRIRQIKENFVRFEPLVGQPAGKNAEIELVYRNASHVSFTAKRFDLLKYTNYLKEIYSSIKTASDLNSKDLSQYIPSNYDSNFIINQITNGNFLKYLDSEEINWEEELSPDLKHYDKRILIKSPLKEAGLYYVTAKAKDGNNAQILIWIEPVVMTVRSQSKNSQIYVADAITGRPAVGQKINLYGTKFDYFLNQPVAKYEELEFTTDEKGSFNLSSTYSGFNWIAVTSSGNGILTNLSVNNYGASSSFVPEIKVYGVSDRQVYRPGDSVKFKATLKNIGYGKEVSQAKLPKNLNVNLYNSKGNSIYSQSLSVDEFGGADGEVKLPIDASLGQYYFYFQGYSSHMYIQVEEYKKPEYEVNIETANKSPLLGQTIPVEISAKYYFGQPVTEGKLTYKVYRSEKNTFYYPICKWDWLFGNGYLFKTIEMNKRYNYRGYNSGTPVLVIDETVELDKDGKFKFVIDTSDTLGLESGIDYDYKIEARVVDASRREIISEQSLTVSEHPFDIFISSHYGYYSPGDQVNVDIQSISPVGAPISAKGKLEVTGLTDKTIHAIFDVETDASGNANLKLNAYKAGQYQIKVILKDSNGNSVEKTSIFNVYGEGNSGKGFQFEKLEVVSDHRDYKVGDKVNIKISSEFEDGSVLLYLRPDNGNYPDPILLNIKNHIADYSFTLNDNDQPNIFVEAQIIHDAKIYRKAINILIPPESKLVNIKIEPDQFEYQPGKNAKVKLKITDSKGEPFKGVLTLSAYDKSIDYFATSKALGIQKSFWGYSRNYFAWNLASSEKNSSNIFKSSSDVMSNIGIFGDTLGALQERADGGMADSVMESGRSMAKKSEQKNKGDMLGNVAAPAVAAEAEADASATQVQPAVRKEFADTIYWNAKIMTDEKGEAVVDFKLAENLTTWKLKALAATAGNEVGEANIDIVTSKKVIVRLQAPRFFVEGDEVTLTANLHNYLKNSKDFTVNLKIPENFKALGKLTETVKVDSNKEASINFLVKAIKEGSTKIELTALSDEESDAVEQAYPVLVHGADKFVSFSRIIKDDQKSTEIEFDLPKEIKDGSQKLIVNLSPSLALSMIDALPYLVSYEYECAEQTLNRFLPSLYVKNSLQKLGIKPEDLAVIDAQLNSQKIEKDSRAFKNPAVFSQRQLNSLISKNHQHLLEMQLSDGGFAWFYGWGAKSDAYFTAYITDGLLQAEKLEIESKTSISRSLVWLENYQARQVLELQKYEQTQIEGKSRVADLDIFIYKILSSQNKMNSEMRRFILRDQNDLSVHTKALLAMAMYQEGDTKVTQELMKNIEQFLNIDNENQTAFLRLPNRGYWWYWYGNELETMSIYFRLLMQTGEKKDLWSSFAKYLLNNRQNGVHWDSTRSTAEAIHALSDYIEKSGESEPNLDAQVLLDGKEIGNIKINSTNIFTYNPEIMLDASELKPGKHKVTINKSGKGNLYISSYVSYFSKEDFITGTGLDLKVERKYYRLNRKDYATQLKDKSGLPLGGQVENYVKEELKVNDQINSGDLIEVELIIDTKNDVEHLIFEDFKPAGLEAVKVVSGYDWTSGAFIEYRDQKVGVFLDRLLRGRKSLSYRMRAEIPGKFSALPVQGKALYSPELRTNSDEWKVQINDQK